MFWCIFSVDEEKIPNCRLFTSFYLRDVRAWETLSYFYVFLFFYLGNIKELKQFTFRVSQMFQVTYIVGIHVKGGLLPCA